MKLSEMKHKVAIQKPGRTQDEGGGYQVAWQTLYNVRAKVVAKDGNEMLRGSRIEALTPWEVTVRYSPLLSVDPSMRIVLENGKILALTSIVNVDEATRWVRFDCTEVQ